MAQHINIDNMPQKVFQKIKASIIKDFKCPWIKGSLKYQWDQKTSDFYKENPDEEVFLCERYIGKGFVFGSERGAFEIHFDTKNKKVNKIYFVA